MIQRVGYVVYMAKQLAATYMVYTWIVDYNFSWKDTEYQQ